VDLLAEPKDSRGGARGLWLLIALAAVTIVAVAAWWLLWRPAVRPVPTPVPVQRRPPVAKATPTPAPVPGATMGTLEVQASEPGAAVSLDGEALGNAPRSIVVGPGRHNVRVTKDGFEPWELDVHVVPGQTTRARARLSGEAPRLRVDSDVPGATVFLDRKFLGTTPLEARDVTPGSHRLNVSADGYELYGESVEIGRGVQEVMVRFKEVRLDQKVAVVHKHGMGACRGTLVATTAGLSYDTADAGDAFRAPFSALEPLQVDYLKKNLRVKLRGGRTYNFTADSADHLLSFQKAVEAARKKL
jgi:hypothetical protein